MSTSPEKLTNVTIDEVETLHEGNFIVTQRIHYHDVHGKARLWEAVQRKKNRGAVHIVAKMVPSGRYLFVRQFRIPMNSYCVECPAGLIDPGEAPETTAGRELHEETGYQGILDYITPPTGSSPGLTGECVNMAFMTVDETAPVNANPVQELDPEESIEVLKLTLPELETYLKDAVSRGDRIDSRLAAWAAAMGLRW